MPSFAKADNPYADPLENVWKNKETDVVADIIKESRTRAAHILRTIFPSKVTQLRELIASFENESSPFWKGQVYQGDYLRPSMLHWSAASSVASPAATTSSSVTSGISDLSLDTNKSTPQATAGVQIVLPDDLARIYDEQDSKTAGKEGKDQSSVPLGQHFFEVIPRNKVQSQCIEIALREFEEFYDLVNELKLWLECEVPQIEDGNSFGTEIQQHLINQLINTNKAIVSWENSVRQHHSDRAKYCTEWVKTPNVEDWQLTIAASDRFDHHLIRGYLMRALTNYVGLLVKFERNWEKVVWPKGKQGGGGGTIGMY